MGRTLGSGNKVKRIGKVRKTKRGRLQEIVAKQGVDGTIQILSRPPKRKVFKSEETRRRQLEALARGQAKPGEVRNPNGRPAGQTISEALRMFGKEECKLPDVVKKIGKGFSYFQAISLQAQQAAARNDRYAREFVAERTEGRVPQTILTDPPPKSPLTDAEKALILDLLERATIPAEQSSATVLPSEGAADVNT